MNLIPFKVIKLGTEYLGAICKLSLWKSYREWSLWLNFELIWEKLRCESWHKVLGDLRKIYLRWNPRQPPKRIILIEETCGILSILWKKKSCAQGPFPWEWFFREYTRVDSSMMSQNGGVKQPPIKINFEFEMQVRTFLFNQKSRSEVAFQRTERIVMF